MPSKLFSFLCFEGEEGVFEVLSVEDELLELLDPDILLLQDLVVLFADDLFLVLEVTF